MGNQEFIRMSKGQSQSGTLSGRRTLERCKSKGKTKNVVYVDVENDKTPDVILLDDLEVSQKGIAGSRKLPKQSAGDSNFISIDDDDVTLDETENCSQENGGTSMKGSFPAFNRSESSKKSQFEEFQFASGKRSPLTFSKSRRTYSEKTLPRNRFGLSPLYDSSSSDEESDCELMVGSSGKIRELWEKAASKRRVCEGVVNDHPSLDDEVSGSGSFTDTINNFEVGQNSNCNVETPLCSTSNEANNENRGCSTSTVRCDGATGDSFLNCEEDPVADTVRRDGATGDSFLNPEEDIVVDLHKAVDQDIPLRNGIPPKGTHIFDEKVDNGDRGEFFHFDHLLSDDEVQCDRSDIHDYPFKPMRETEIPVAPEFNHETDCYQEAEVNEIRDNLFDLMRETGIPVAPEFNPEDDCDQEEVNLNAESFWFNYEMRAETVFNHDKTIPKDEDVSMHTTEKLNGTPVNFESPNTDEVIHQSCVSNIQSPNSKIYDKTNSSYKEKSILEGLSMWNDQPCGKMHVDNDLPFSTEKDKSVLQEDITSSDHTECESTVNPDSVGHLDNEELACKIFSSNSQQNETPNLHASYFMDERDPFIDSSIIISERSLLGTQNENGALEVENDIICGREKLKETDEYRRATEEEWASRQQQLQIQAEEAQKLRKRKRAETQRLLDMERRQKERVEEMREAQKKNVETSNLKEQFRAEIRKELGRLELINTDMISILRALGIKVGSGFSPTSHEVNAAYKRALLKFHPDRASKTDIRQQVEAEEKFKLISRLKDKITSLTNSKSRYF